jgi:CubicO group peptidase (beta-lactamase class C family)
MSTSVMLRSSLTVLITLCVGASSLAAQSERTQAQKLDSLAGSGVLENRVIGIVAAVVKGNDTLLLKGYGKANAEWDVPMPADAMFEIGSVAKQFTAAAILQLRDAGKLSLDDDITKWLPDFDTRGNKVPLRRLLDHTSGIVGLTEMPEFGALASNPRFPRDSGYALIKRAPFQFPTGTAQIYNNSAFWLLGLVVEKASGMSYEDYVEKQIFEPLGMKRSMYCNSGEHVARRAHGYGVQRGMIRRAPMNVHTWPFSAGSICSTAGDLVTWLKALHGGKVLSPKSYSEMTTPSKLNDGTPLWYGMGVQVGTDVRGLRYIGHGGSIAGFSSEAGWYPDAQMAVVVLMNTTGNLDPGAVGGELAAEVLPWTRPTYAPFAGDAASLVGTYKGPSRGRDMVVEVSQTPQGVAFAVNGAPARQLPWVEGLTFRNGGTLLTFRRSGNAGPATELRSQNAGALYILKRQ